MRKLKVCKNSSGVLYIFLPVDFVRKADIKYGDYLVPKVLKNRLILVPEKSGQKEKEQ
jgi:hypothetical protein